MRLFSENVKTINMKFGKKSVLISLIDLSYSGSRSINLEGKKRTKIFFENSHFQKLTSYKNQLLYRNIALILLAQNYDPFILKAIKGSQISKNSHVQKLTHIVTS